MEINIGMSECHKNVDNYYGSHITVWIPRCAGREAFDGVEPLHGLQLYLKLILYVSLHSSLVVNNNLLDLCIFV